jgi:hypothetical protein
MMLSDGDDDGGGEEGQRGNRSVFLVDMRLPCDSPVELNERMKAGRPRAPTTPYYAAATSRRSPGCALSLATLPCARDGQANVPA